MQWGWKKPVGITRTCRFTQGQVQLPSPHLVGPSNNGAAFGPEIVGLSTSVLELYAQSPSPTSGLPRLCLDFCRKYSGVPPRCPRWEIGQSLTARNHLEGTHLQDQVSAPLCFDQALLAKIIIESQIRSCSTGTVSAKESVWRVTFLSHFSSAQMHHDAAQ